MHEVQIQLAAIWVALMLIYLLGDVLRIFSGDYRNMDTDINDFTQPMWLGISILMSIPIVMILLSVMLEYPINRPANIIVAGCFFLFNLVGLPSYPGAYDKFLAIFGLVLNIVTMVHAWNWTL